MGRVAHAAAGTRLGFGFAAGALIAFLDNVAFAGEVSPIVVVAALLAATLTVGAVWGRHGWPAAAAVWVCVPSVHFVKHLLGLPDTIQPNTWASIAMLAAFSLVVAAVGTVLGVVVRGAAK